MATPRTWSSLAESTKTRYRRQGVTPARYNAWNRLGKKKLAAYKEAGVKRMDYLTAESGAAALNNAWKERVVEHGANLFKDSGYIYHPGRAKENLAGLTNRQLRARMKYTRERWQDKASDAAVAYQEALKAAKKAGKPLTPEQIKYLADIQSKSGWYH